MSYQDIERRLQRLEARARRASQRLDMTPEVQVQSAQELAAWRRAQEARLVTWQAAVPATDGSRIGHRGPC